MYSYTADYSELATGTERSLFEGGFLLNAGNELHGVLLEYAPGPALYGILSQSGPIIIDNSVIGTEVNRYDIGVHLINTTNAVISNTAIYGVSKALFSESSTFQIQTADLNALKTINLSAEGIWAINSSGTLDNSVVFSSTTGFVNTNTDYGIRARDNSFLVINTSDITVGTPGEEHGTQNALRNEGPGGNITMNSNEINLFNDPGSLGSSVVSVGDVTIGAGVTCFKNGSGVPC